MPLALAKIHAQLALGYVERKRLDLARTQVALLRELVSNAAVVEMAADLVLNSAKLRLREYSQRVKNEVAECPERAASLANNLMAPTFFLFEVIDLFFGEADYIGKDLLDETISVCVDCVVIYQRKTGNNHVFVDLLRRLHPLTANKELDKRIFENLRVGIRNLEIEDEKKRANNKSVSAAAFPQQKKFSKSNLSNTKKKKSWFKRLLG